MGTIPDESLPVNPEARFQAEKLIDFVRRGGDARRWWRSKDFSRRWRAMILRAVAELETGA